LSDTKPVLPMMKLKAIWFAVLSITVFFPGMPSRAENPIKASPDRFSIAVECVKRFEGWHGEKKHWPYVGWGHKVLPGERFTNSITKAQGDSILRADLRKLCRMFSYLGRDSLILSEISDKIRASFTKRDGEMISFLQRAFLRFYFMPFQTFFPVFS
jgi:lysozyme